MLFCCYKITVKMVSCLPLSTKIFKFSERDNPDWLTLPILEDPNQVIYPTQDPPIRYHGAIMTCWMRKSSMISEAQELRLWTLSLGSVSQSQAEIPKVTWVVLVSVGWWKTSAVCTASNLFSGECHIVIEKPCHTENSKESERDQMIPSQQSDSSSSGIISDNNESDNNDSDVENETTECNTSNTRQDHNLSQVSVTLLP